MNIKEFVEKGFLQEANRLFFHPLGLALETSINEKGEYLLSGIWDYREDEEGIVFENGSIDIDKIINVQKERQKHAPVRSKMFKGNIQSG